MLQRNQRTTVWFTSFITSHSSRTNNSWLFAPSSLILANYHLPLNGALCAKETMEFNQAEVKVINSSIKFVNSWVWLRWGFLVLSSILFVLSFYLIPTTGNVWGNNLHIFSVLIFIYLSRNWSKPTKESLLLKLVAASSAHNKPLKQDK